MIHAYGATVTLNAVDNINLTISGDGGALMSQAKESGASLLKVVSSQGSISIKSDSSSVLAEALTDSIKKDKSEVILSAAKDVSESAMKICLQKMPPYVELGDNHRAACWLCVQEQMKAQIGRAHV